MAQRSWSIQRKEIEVVFTEALPFKEGYYVQRVKFITQYICVSSMKNQIETSLTYKIFGDTSDKSSIVVLSMPEVRIIGVFVT